MLRAGDLVLEDRRIVDGAMLTLLKPQRHVYVIVPLQAEMRASQEAVPLATLQETWQPPPC
jgi:hypothetical protein